MPLMKKLDGMKRKNAPFYSNQSQKSKIDEVSKMLK